MRMLLTCLLFIATACRAADEFHTSALPTGKIRVDIMQPMAPPRAAELTAKLQASIKNNRDWWIAHVQRTPPGEPLPWDERLGLSRAEYDEYQKVSREIRLEKSGEAELEFVRVSDGRITIKPDASLPELANVVIDVRNNFVETPFGRTNDSSNITASAEQHATGPWNVSSGSSRHQAPRHFREPS